MQGDQNGKELENIDPTSEIMDTGQEIAKVLGAGALKPSNVTTRYQLRGGVKRQAVGSPPRETDRVEDETMNDLVRAVDKACKLITDVGEKLMANSKIKNNNSITKQLDLLKDMNNDILKGFVMKELKTLELVEGVNVEEYGGKRDLNLPGEPRPRYFCDRCSVEIEQEEEEIKEIRGKFKDIISSEKSDYIDLVNRKWPEKTFEITKEVVGNPLSTKEGDLVIFIKERKEDTVLFKMMKSRYPELEDIMEEDTEESRVQYLENIIKTKKTTNTRRIHLIETKGESDLRRFLITLRDENMVPGYNKMSVAVSSPELRSGIRKAMEIIFKDVGVEMEFFISKNEDTYMRESFQDKRGREKNEAVVIKTNVSTYADTLRNIRAVVFPEEIGVKVNTIKVNKDHNVVISTNKGMAEILHKEILNKTKGVESIVTGTNKSILIFDIDASINGKEIESYIRQETRAYETIVRNLRTSRAGTQIATVSMPAKVADALLEAGDIKIGWYRCRVKEKIDIIRCYNCLHLGHHSDICKEPKVDKRCLNCTQPGHLVKDCNNTSYCLACQKSGHRCDSDFCPTFRKIVQEMRSKETRLKNDEDKNKDIVTVTEEENDGNEGVNLMETEDIAGNTEKQND